MKWESKQCFYVGTRNSCASLAVCTAFDGFSTCTREHAEHVTWRKSTYLPILIPLSHHVLEKKKKKRKAYHRGHCDRCQVVIPSTRPQNIILLYTTGCLSSRPDKFNNFFFIEYFWVFQKIITSLRYNQNGF